MTAVAGLGRIVLQERTCTSSRFSIERTLMPPYLRCTSPWGGGVMRAGEGGGVKGLLALKEEEIKEKQLTPECLHCYSLSSDSRAIRAFTLTRHSQHGVSRSYMSSRPKQSPKTHARCILALEKQPCLRSRAILLRNSLKSKIYKMWINNLFIHFSVDNTTGAKKKEEKSVTVE